MLKQAICMFNYEIRETQKHILIKPICFCSAFCILLIHVSFFFSFPEGWRGKEEEIKRGQEKKGQKCMTLIAILSSRSSTVKTHQKHSCKWKYHLFFKTLEEIQFPLYCSTDIWVMKLYVLFYLANFLMINWPTGLQVILKLC